MEEKKLIEKFAELCHMQWSDWMKYLYEKSIHIYDNSYVIPKELTERWKRQIATDYKNLSENEKESDRIEARKFIELLKNSGEYIEEI